MLTGKFFIVTGGDGRGVIVEKVLDLVNEYLPSSTRPLALPGVLTLKLATKSSASLIEDEPFAALAFKIATDPFVGKLAYFRVYSGKVTAGQLCS